MYVCKMVFTDTEDDSKVIIYCTCLGSGVLCANSEIPALSYYIIVWLPQTCSSPITPISGCEKAKHCR